MYLINSPQFQKKYEQKFCHPGNRKKVVYKYELVPGKIDRPVRVPNGFVDLEDFIQESASDIDFKSLGNALVGAGGDVRQHFYSEEPITDVSQLPHNIHELSAMHNKLKTEFDKLPEDIQALFEGDYEKFIAAGREGTIGQTISDFYASKTQPVDVPETPVESDGDK